MKTVITLVLTLLLYQAAGADYRAGGDVRPVQRHGGSVYALKSGNLYRDSKEIYAGKLVDFSVGKKLIAAVGGDQLYLLGHNGKMVKTFDTNLLGPYWAGPYLWAIEQDETRIKSFDRIDTRTMRMAEFRRSES